MGEDLEGQEFGPEPEADPSNPLHRQRTWQHLNFYTASRAGVLGKIDLAWPTGAIDFSEFLLAKTNRLGQSYFVQRKQQEEREPLPAVAARRAQVGAIGRSESTLMSTSDRLQSMYARKSAPKSAPRTAPKPDFAE